MALKNNTWKLNQWYDQDVAGNVRYSGLNLLWGWGDNENGGLGLNSTNAGYSSPIQVSDATTWKFPPSGASHTAETSVLVKTDGTLWSWGYNTYGMLGQNSVVHISSPTQIPGTTWNTAIMGRNNTTQYSSPIQVPGTTWNIVSSSYADEIMAIKTDGAMWNWGRSGYTGGPIFEGQAFPSMRSSPVQLPGTWANVLDTRRLTFAEKVI